MLSLFTEFVKEFESNDLSNYCILKQLFVEGEEKIEK